MFSGGVPLEREGRRIFLGNLDRVPIRSINGHLEGRQNGEPFSLSWAPAGSRVGFSAVGQNPAPGPLNP